LKEELKLHGLRANGCKKEILVERLKTFIELTELEN